MNAKKKRAGSVKSGSVTPGNAAGVVVLSANAWISCQTVVSVKARLVDARTGTLLWQGQASASDAEGRDNNNGVLGVLLTSVIHQLASNIGNPGHQVAKVASARLLSPHNGGLLYGPRSPNYGKD